MPVERISSLHALRGLAALLVAVGHSYYFGFDGPIQEKYLGANLYDIIPSLSAGFPLYEYIFSGIFPVAIFFLLSGFVLENSLKQLTSLPFLINRIFRIYPIYLLAFFVHLFLVEVISGQDIPAEQIISEASLYGHQNIVAVGWTLYFEMRYYFLIGLLCLIGAKTRYRTWLILALFAYQGGGTLFWISFMAIGAQSAHIFYAKRKKIENILQKFEISAFILIWSYLAIGYYDYPAIYNIPKLELLSALIVFWAALICHSINFNFRPLTFLANVSYPLYCIHMPIVVLAHFFCARYIPIIVIAPMSILVALIVAWVIHLLIEKPSAELGKLVTRSVPHISLSPITLLKQSASGLMARDAQPGASKPPSGID